MTPSHLLEATVPSMLTLHQGGWTTVHNEQFFLKGCFISEIHFQSNGRVDGPKYFRTSLMKEGGVEVR